MTLQELRYLVALADKGHFVSAAHACHVGQPTLSMQLKKLESHLGVRLFDRNNHKVVPTPIGVEIITRARVALEVVEEIRELAHQARGPMEGALRLGVIPTLGPYLIPRMLPALRSRFPQFRLHPSEGMTAELLEGLRQHRFDALLLSLPVPARDVETLPLFREALVMALPAGHALGRKRQIGPDELSAQPILLLEEGHCLRAQAMEICGARPLQQGDEELTAGSIETLRQMVAAGVGCALMPSLAVLPDAGSPHPGPLTIRPLALPAAVRTVGMVWRPRCPQADTVVSLARFIQASLPLAAVAIPCGDRRGAHERAKPGVS